MSVKISGKVWELDIEPIDKLVMLALADHADHEGRNIRPGLKMLVAKTGLTKQTVIKKVRYFFQQGWLENDSGSTSKGGRGRKRIFSLDVEKARRRAYFIEREHERAAKKAKSTAGGIPLKGEAALPFTAETGEPQEARKGEAALPFLAQQKGQPGNTKGQPGNTKGQPGNTKGQPDAISHDKERARLNRHEPSHEPSVVVDDDGNHGNHNNGWLAPPLVNHSDAFEVKANGLAEDKLKSGNWSALEAALADACLWDRALCSDLRREKIRLAAVYLTEAHSPLNLDYVRRAREYYNALTPPKLRIMPQFIQEDYRQIADFLSRKDAQHGRPATVNSRTGEETAAELWLSDIEAFAAGQAPQIRDELRELLQHLAQLDERSQQQERVLKRLREVLPRDGPAMAEV